SRALPNHFPRRYPRRPARCPADNDRPAGGLPPAADGVVLAPDRAVRLGGALEPDGLSPAGDPGGTPPRGLQLPGRCSAVVALAFLPCLVGPPHARSVAAILALGGPVRTGLVMRRLGWRLGPASLRRTPLHVPGCRSRRLHCA